MERGTQIIATYLREKHGQQSCCWCLENSEVGSTGKFVIGSTNYQLSDTKDHHTSYPYDEAIKTKEYAVTKKAGVLFPPQKVVLKIPTDPAIVRSWQ